MTLSPLEQVRIVFVQAAPSTNTSWSAMVSAPGIASFSLNDSTAGSITLVDLPLMPHQPVDVTLASQSKTYFMSGSTCGPSYPGLYTVYGTLLQAADTNAVGGDGPSSSGWEWMGTCISMVRLQEIAIECSNLNSLPHFSSPLLQLVSSFAVFNFCIYSLQTLFLCHINSPFGFHLSYALSLIYLWLLLCSL